MTNTGYANLGSTNKDSTIQALQTEIAKLKAGKKQGGYLYHIHTRLTETLFISLTEYARKYGYTLSKTTRQVLSKGFSAFEKDPDII